MGSIIGTVSPTQTISAGNDTTSVRAAATGLASNTKYFYRLAARNQFGTVRGDIVSFRTKP